MKKLIILISIITIGLISCDKNEESNEIKFECSDNETVCDLVKSNNEFGLDIFKILHNKHLKDNVFISPFSISTALAMTVNGAKGETKSEMINTLKYNGWNLDSINNTYKEYLGIIPNLDDKVKMNIANSIWYREGFSVLDEFININKDNYFSEVLTRDFSNPNTLDEINTWVENKTEGKIKDILDQISPQAVMFLINAIYFKGDWKYQFETKNTFDGKFFLEDGSKVDSRMMKIKDLKLPFYRNDKLRMVDLPYGDSIYSMMFIAPNVGHTLDDIIDDLDITSWNDYIVGLNDTKISIQMPKFKIEFKEELKDILIDLNMVKAFDSKQADFSGINGSGGLFISKVIHQSFVEVDEKGTEAAAATVVGIDVTSIGNYFDLVKPFVFVIRDNSTNSILFIGKMMDPS